MTLSWSLEEEWSSTTQSHNFICRWQNLHKDIRRILALSVTLSFSGEQCHGIGSLFDTGSTACEEAVMY